MSRSRIIAIIFVVVALLQLAVPASLIIRYERTLREGKVFKFRTAPVDPADAFRGRYVALRYETSTVPWQGKERPESRSQVYALIENSADGFAKFTSAMPEKPAGGDYVHVNGWEGAEGMMHIEPMFDRFYMEESTAPRAEEVYRKHNLRTGTQDAYVVVHVLDGTVVIKQVYVGDKTLADAVKEIAK